MSGDNDLEAVRGAARSLRWIFVGGLLVIFDITFTFHSNGSTGFRFDILNDVIGALMIAVAANRLHDCLDEPWYRSSMRFVTWVASLTMLQALVGHFVFETGPVLALAIYLFGIAQLAATVIFSRAMRGLSEHWELVRAERSRRVTTILILLFHVLPLGAIHVVGILAVASDAHIDLALGPVAGLLLLAAVLIPVVHLFVSTSRMWREAGETARRRAGCA